ncbi:hypothetical protein Patl1_03744 [Pistacia atlantica]|uniref:Uncharacterized protein n=1 Tax=Pistacia atlantica TaxID=434234 RepID=A0ACC1BUJ1_9ROSI|nr:hypothetical protein Patl1_03744 [Pistacia atlantica]
MAAILLFLGVPVQDHPLYPLNPLNSLIVAISLWLIFHHTSDSKDSNRPSPTAELLAPHVKRDLNLRSSQHNVDRVGKIIFADQCVYRWFVVDLADNHQFPSFVHLEPISEPIERAIGEKSLVLVNNHADKGNDEVGGNISSRTRDFVAKNAWPDLLTSFNNLRNKMECKELEKVKPVLVARFGKILFRGNYSVNIEKVRKDPVAETTLKQLRRQFYTNVPMSYMENIISEVVPKVGVDFEADKDVYYIWDDEMQSLRNLINSAVLDPGVKGCLRWPLGKSNLRVRYRVSGVWHTEVKLYESSSLRLKVGHADRFSFKSSTGESTLEITLKLKRLASDILEQKVDTDTNYNMFKDTLGLMWDHFLCCEHFLT